MWIIIKEEKTMDKRGKKAAILTVFGIILVIIGVGVVILIIKNPLKREKMNNSSESKKVIQLDVPGGVTSETEEIEKETTLTEEKEVSKVKTSEKTSEKKTDNKKVVTSEKTSEEKKTEEPPLIIENPKEEPSRHTTTNQTPVNKDEVIELPLIPYEEIKEN